ncbi:MAG TPA: recombination regulator RecX [Burkholderiales bacterium]|nr:recombination regulator RecX [Burkholderiales bacterium]
MSLRARALRLLARREYSRQQLAQRLGELAPDQAALDQLLDELQSHGWLSEQRVAEQVLRAAAGRFGSLRVAQQLIARGVSTETAEQALAGLRADELGNARAALRKRFARSPADPAEYARQARFLAQRGFDEDVIEQALGRSREQ